MSEPGHSCPNCGALILPGDQYCESCGAHLRAETASVDPEAERPPKTSRRRWYLGIGAAIILGVCLITCVAVIITTALLDDDESEDQASQQPESGLAPTAPVVNNDIAAPVFTEIENGIARTASGEVPIPASVGDDPVSQARAYVDQFPDLYPIPAGSNLSEMTVMEVDTGGHVVSFGFDVDGVLVDGAGIKVHVAPGHTVTWATASYPTSLDVNTTPQVSQEDATAIAIERLEALDLEGEIVAFDTQMTVFNEGLFSDSVTESKLAWKVEIASDLVGATMIIDAMTGEVLEFWDDFDPLIAVGDPEWSIYTIENSTYKNKTKAQIENTRVMQINEDGEVAGVAPPADATARSVADYIRQVLDYYRDSFGRESYDGAGARVHIHVHAGSPNHKNAHWSRSKDGMFIGDQRVALDVVAHEFTHGIITKTVQLVGSDTEAGSLNESLSDVFAAFMTGDWTIGENTAAGEVRDLTTLGDDPDDLDTKHKRSVTPSHAAYLITDNTAASLDKRKVASPEGEITWTGIGTAKAQQIYYRVLANDMLASTASFSDLRNQLRAACLELVEAGRYGLVLHDCGVILNAFAAVGIGSVDSDFDTIPDLRRNGTPFDNCRTTPNPEQEDDDRDNQGDACEGWVILKIEQTWRTATDLCNPDSPPTTALRTSRTKYYFGVQEDIQTYADGARRDRPVGIWVNTSGDSWEIFDVSTPTITEVADQAAGQNQVDAIRNANPSGRDEDDEYEVWSTSSEVNTPVPLSSDEIRAACGDDSFAGNEPEELTWVLVDTQVNPQNAELEITFSEPRWVGSYDRWSVSETSMSAQHYRVDGGTVVVDVTTDFGFNAPPATLIPGETIELSAAGSMSASKMCISALEQFQYEVNDIQVPESYFKLAMGNCSCSGGSEQCGIQDIGGATTSVIEVPTAASLGTEFTISAGLWNCSACNIVWIYKLQ